jgi:hypothetical protein
MEHTAARTSGIVGSKGCAGYRCAAFVITWVQIGSARAEP